jgi:hypothetical protein
MKLRTQLSVLHPEIVVCLVDDDKLDLVVKVKDIPNELKERSVKKLYNSYSDSEYDLYIKLKV